MSLVAVGLTNPWQTLRISRQYSRLTPRAATNINCRWQWCEQELKHSMLPTFPYNTPWTWAGLSLTSTATCTSVTSRKLGMTSCENLTSYWMVIAGQNPFNLVTWWQPPFPLSSIVGERFGWVLWGQVGQPFLPFLMLLRFTGKKSPPYHTLVNGRRTGTLLQ